nr:mitogen-activated protein kinase kinase kinase 7-like [Leptinotarsa decemlineata]
MCDCPIAGVVTSHEAYRSWIIFKECKTDNGTANTIQAGVQSSSESSHGNQDLDNMYVLLDPHLRPATPDYSEPKSVTLFEEHKQLAKEYWKVQTELVLLSQKKNQLLADEEEDQRRKMNLKALQEEKESLRLARDLLLQQKERNSAPGNSSRNSGDGWIYVSREDAGS